MNLFYFKECTSKTVVDIKTTKKRQSNNKNAIDNFSLLLNDTKTAIGNIESCLESEEESRQIYLKMVNGDMTFADDMLGLCQKGKNDSHYRSYLALDKTSIIEVRIGNHYETKKAAKQKSNNKSQYLFQVVVSENEQSVPNGSESIKNVCRVGNLRVLTKKFLSSESPMEDFIEILQSIHDYLISPSESYDAALSAQTNDAQSTQVANNQNNCNKNMKQTIKLTENELRRMIVESVREVLNEIQNEEHIYDMEQWRMDGTLKPKEGQLVSDDVVNELANSVPPTTWSHNYLQPGEAYDFDPQTYKSRFMTFQRVDSNTWKYIGLKSKINSGF